MLKLLSYFDEATALLYFAQSVFGENKHKPTVREAEEKNHLWSKGGNCKGRESENTSGCAVARGNAERYEGNIAGRHFYAKKITNNVSYFLQNLVFFSKKMIVTR